MNERMSAVRILEIVQTIRDDAGSVWHGCRCTGFAIGDGNYSGCAIGDGEDPKKFGDDVCPACNNTGVA